MRKIRCFFQMLPLLLAAIPGIGLEIKAEFP